MVWPTATSRDWKDGACAEANVPTNGLLGRAVLCPQVVEVIGRAILEVDRGGR